MVDKRMTDKEWNDLMQVVGVLKDAQIKFCDDHMKVIKAVAECYPFDRGFECIFCEAARHETHNDGCPYILARKIMENE